MTNTGTKTAVLISGQMRTLDLCFDNQFWMLYRKLDEPHFYISAADDEDSGKAEIFLKRFPADRVHIEVVKQPETIHIPGATSAHAPFPPSAPEISILRQLWHLNRVWEFFTETQSALPVTQRPNFMYHVRTRPDLWFHFLDVPPVYPWRHDKGSMDETAITPWWSRWGGINDRIAFMGRDSAEAYFTAFTALPGMIMDGCPLHPETIMGYALERSKMVSLATLPAWFTTVRKPKPGERACGAVPPDANINDLADYMKATSTLPRR